MGVGSIGDKFLCYLATLIAACYVAYITMFPDPADGLVFSAVIGAIALMGGVKLNEKLPPGER